MKLFKVKSYLLLPNLIQNTFLSFEMETKLSCLPHTVFFSLFPIPKASFIPSLFFFFLMFLWCDTFKTPCVWSSELIVISIRWTRVLDQFCCCFLSFRDALRNISEGHSHQLRTSLSRAGFPQ